MVMVIVSDGNDDGNSCSGGNCIADGFCTEGVEEGMVIVVVMVVMI